MGDAERLGRFRGDLEALTGGPPDRLGIAVSGGPDSLALLLLAAAAYPGRIAAATVDHRLRPESGAEAAAVGAICGARQIPHSVLVVDWAEPPTANVQALARARRYALLGGWAREQGLTWVATGHHLDDQAETILMRLARGAGIAGLCGIRATYALADATAIVRPLLGWRRKELAAIVAAADVAPVDDPSNRSERFDRTRFRQLLETAQFLEPGRISTAGRNLIDAEDALRWAETQAWRARARPMGAGWEVNARDLPFELVRRLAVRAVAELLGDEAAPWRQDRLPGVLDAARTAGAATIAGIVLRHTAPGVWRFEAAPPRRHRAPRRETST